MDDRTPRIAPAEPLVSAPAPRRRGRRALRLVVWLLVIAGLLGLAWWLRPGQTPGPGGAGRFASAGPMPVVGAAARKGDMPVVLTELGAVTPLATVTVQSQISGQLTQVGFTEGQMVKEGDFLAQIDPRPYQVALEQAEGALARDQALLANARVDLKRYETLFAQDSIAEQQLATQRALVAQDEGTVKTDEGQVDQARLNLVYCHITSPVTGRVGLRQVDQGNYVTPAEPNGLVVITQLQPITVLFTLPEDNLPDVMARLHQGAVLPVTAYDRSRSRKLAEGTLATVDNQIDTSTGTVKMRANFANDRDELFPNQFVNVDLLLDTLHDATLVPQSAIQRGAPGTFVYVIGQDRTVSVRPVTLGPGNAQDVSVRKGLEPGELVVVDGADKLKDGAPVTLPAEGPAPAAAGQHRSHGGGQGGGQNGWGGHHRHDDGGGSPPGQPTQPAPPAAPQH